MDKYYVLHDKIIQSMKARRFEDVLSAVQETIPLYKDLVQKTKREYGAFDIQTSIAVDKGAKVAAALGRNDILKSMESTLRQISETGKCADDVAKLIEDSTIGNRIVQLVEQHPGLVQRELKAVLLAADQSRISNICYWLEKVGRVRREKEGKSYKLFI